MLYICFIQSQIKIFKNAIWYLDHRFKSVYCLFSMYYCIPENQDKIDELMNRMMGCDMTYASAHVELEKVSFVIGYTLHSGLKPYPIW